MRRWLQSLHKKAVHKTKVARWEMELDRLMNLCGETGGENSPYFEKLDEHLRKRPNDVVN